MASAVVSMASGLGDRAFEETCHIWGNDVRIENFQIYGNVKPESYSDRMVLNDIRCISSDIEKRFGPAVNEWVLGGIDFDVAEEQPFLFYPYSRPGTVIIKLAGPAL